MQGITVLTQLYCQIHTNISTACFGPYGHRQVGYSIRGKKLHNTIWYSTNINGRSHWSRGLRRRSAAARLLRLWVRIPPGAWMFICECFVLSGRGLWDELITRPEESYRLWCVVVCDLETS